MNSKLSDLWTTKSGDKLKISEMSSSHIKNAMGLIHKRDFKSLRVYGDVIEYTCWRGKYERMELELQRRAYE